MSGPLPDDHLPDATVRYAEHEDAVVDLHLPPVPNGRTVLLVHGGFWKAEYDRRHTRPVAAALAGEGYVVATPEYRRVRAGGGWPITGDDVRRATERLPELLHGMGITPGPVTAVGHSAGGHLALWLAATGTDLERVVGLAAVSDLREAVRLDLGNGAAVALMGDTDPAAADPMTLFGPDPAVDVTLVHGRADTDVPISLSRGFVAAHPWARLVEVDGGHFRIMTPWTEPFATVLDVLSA